MFHLYTNKARIPSNKKYIIDGGFLIDVFGVKSEFAKEIITSIDKGSYYNDSMFTDRFGGNLYYNCLSTTSKLLIALEEESDYCIDISEMGDNGIQYLLDLNGYAYTNVDYIEFYGSYVELDFNGTIMPAGTASYLMSIDAETIEESYID